jgi:MFS transporter, SP family, galactose:H+ symporter
MATGVPTTATAKSPLIDVPEQALRKIRGYGFLIALGSFMFGYDTGVISGALLFIKQDLGLNDFQQGSVVSVLLIGAIIGAITEGRIADRIGRRAALGVIGVTFAVGLAIAALARSYEVLLVGRVVIGFGVGGVSALIPTYLSEISPAQIRGRVLSLNQLLIVIGLLVSYIVDLVFASSEDWRAMFWVGVIPSVALILASLRLPESFLWQFHHGKVDEARSAMTSLGGAEAAQQALDVMQGETEARQRAKTEQERRGMREERRGMRVLTAPRLRAAVMVSVTLAVLQQFVGINTIMYYAPTIMENTGLSASNAILYSVFIGVINLATTIVSIRLVDRVGRRPLLLVSLGGMLVTLVLLGLSFVADWPSQISLLFILLYIVAFAIGMGPIFWVLVGEIFPTEDRAQGTSLASTFNWTANFAVSLAFLPLIAAIGQGETFWLFAVVCVFAIWFTGRYVPETKNREFLEVDEELQERWKGEYPGQTGPPAPAGKPRATS